MRNMKVQVCYPADGGYSQELVSLSLDLQDQPFCWEIPQGQVLYFFLFIF